MESNLGIRTYLSIAHGSLDYIRTHSSRRDWHGPLNGQIFRQLMVLKLLHYIDFGAIIEAGSFRGSTTEFLSSVYRGPVYSIEANPRSYGFAWARMALYDNCHMILGDSSLVLADLLKSKTDISRPVFVYLDAHWGKVLPIREEIHAIGRSSVSFVALVDDFEVPGDSGYLWDDYGEAGSLQMHYIRDLLQKYNFSAWYPSTSSESESGARRGSLIFASPGLLNRLGNDLCLVCAE